MGRQSMQDRISTCALCHSTATSVQSGQHMSGEQCNCTSYWHLGQVPVTNRSARNLPAASLYSCSMVCSTSCPALSSVLKMPWAVEHTHTQVNMATPVKVAFTNTEGCCGPLQHSDLSEYATWGLLNCSCSQTALHTGVATPCHNSPCPIKSRDAHTWSHKG